ncbi:50S ribosomal protein L11 [Mycoplasmopsis pullorum]|uniref:50S ribosomal protein L11 n=1 Tax=Mycoplasmopsis pullorum TaxID=48003 RepID=UPI00111831DF|nr:50S ribosomal protein L11 [Mycoplasmopsis pullorum]TNK81774.1 50S ribosomal protein L11 [Mycoplasmopsis pullorum]TNK83104.1 50S ribosomal protein L11 [Mycoplasmopsis pullorum]TNK83692.1 50S ribosomal protein L11 [Mycoplasmopsis pullorum]TNK84122.1 50S ribosomal protein L11 [Mycoplasmopsis pullorum]TNK84578.1 50S ribosomal protein L11 [Mycoplasmopsis pullorum]
MAKKEIVRVAKLEFLAGQAKPGPALAGVGVNMPEFTRAFNDATRDRGNEPVPVQITVYKDKSFDFKLFTAPASYKIKQAAKIQSGSSNSKTTIVATISLDQLREIAAYKLPDLNTDDVEAAMHTIAGTAKNMGVLVEGWDDIAKAKAAAKAAAKESALAAAREASLAAAQEDLIESKGKGIEVNAIHDGKEGEEE